MLLKIQIPNLLFLGKGVLPKPYVVLMKLSLPAYFLFHLNYYPFKKSQGRQNYTYVSLTHHIIGLH